MFGYRIKFKEEDVESEPIDPNRIKKGLPIAKFIKEVVSELSLGYV